MCEKLLSSLAEKRLTLPQHFPCNFMSISGVTGILRKYWSGAEKLAINKVRLDGEDL